MEAHQAREEKRSKRTGDLICTRRFTTDEKEPNNRIGQKIQGNGERYAFTFEKHAGWFGEAAEGEEKLKWEVAALVHILVMSIPSVACWYRRYGRVLQDELAGGGNKIFELCQGFDEDDLSTFDANNMVSNDMSESIELGQFQSLWIEMLYIFHLTQTKRIEDLGSDY
ncbi:hypothetical protein L204_100058 [Cryptococcus depauperatus]